MKKKAVLLSTLAIAISLAVSGLAPSVQAIPVTITFDGVLNADGSYTEKGITVTSDSGIVSLGDSSGIGLAEGTGDGSQDLINAGDFFGPIYTFTFFGGQPFNVLSVDVVDPGNATLQPSSLTGTLAGSFTRGGAAPLGSTFGEPGPPPSLNGPGWLNITSFTLQMGACTDAPFTGDCSIAIDNLVIDDLGFSPTPAPEPTTLALLGLGLAGLGFARKRLH